jgi:hypothetical protein
MLPAPVAADGSRRHLRYGKNAPTAVGGYALSAQRVEFIVPSIWPKRRGKLLFSEAARDVEGGSEAVNG